MLPKPETNRYRTFLLRCWQESDASAAGGQWRFSLEESGAAKRAGVRQGFVTAKALAEFLETTLALDPSPGE